MGIVSLVSHSQLATWRRCPREWHYRYQLERAPRAPAAPALLAGKAIHAALGAYHRGEPYEVEDVMHRAMMRGYVARWGDEPRATRTDIPFKVDLGDGISVRGEFDGLGDGFVIEHKTSSEDISPGSAYWRKVLQVDAQVATYLHAAQSMGIDRIVYDVLRKPALRLGKKETPEAFETRICEDIAARPDHYYQRATVVRLEAEREEYVSDVRGTVFLMRTGATPRNVDSCQKWGRDCDFFGVCTGEVSINDDSKFMGRISPNRGETSLAESGNLRGAGSGKIDPSGGDAAPGVYRF